MDPQCHPKLSHSTADDLQAEQDEFFLSGGHSCVDCVSSKPSDNYTCKSPSVAVLNDVFERTEMVKEIKPPTMKPAPTLPRLFKKEKAVQVTDNDFTTDNNNNGDVNSCSDTLKLKEEVSLENDKRLAAMDSDELIALKEELFESIPESFLNKLRNKN